MCLQILMDTKLKSYIPALLLLLVGCFGVWLQLERPQTGIDDADIFLVYARNLAEGHGFVYNIGGEVVEGFTSLLWTLICAAGFTVFQSLEVPLLVLNMVLGVAVVVMCLKRSEYPRLFLVLLAAAPAWFAWCQLTLMESGLWCLLITAAILATVDQRPKLLCLLLPLLVITRPESMLWGAWLLLVLFLYAEKGRRIRTVVFPAAAFGLTLLALVGFRLSYFGYPVPNTYYAKVSSNWFSNVWNGLDYFFSYLSSNPAVLLVMALAAFTLFRWRRQPPASVCLLLCLLPGIGIPVLVGGDHFGAFRFYQPIWPLLCLLAVGNWPVRHNSRLIRRLPVVVLAAGWLLFPFTARLSHEFRIAQEGRDTGAALTRMFSDLEELPSVAVITAGGHKYGYEGVVFDVLGLNSTEMAHAPGPREGFKNHTSFNREVFYRWHPDILLRGDSHEFDSMVLKGLHDEPEFKAQYREVTLVRNGTSVSAYFSDALLSRLSKAAATGRKN